LRQVKSQWQAFERRLVAFLLCAAKKTAQL